MSTTSSRAIPMTVRFMLRTRLVFLTAWLLPLGIFLATTPYPIDSSYPDPKSLQIVGDGIRASLGMVVMYGKVPDNLTVATWTMWENMTWILILGAVMSIFQAVYATRNLEESGITEILHSLGLSPRSLKTVAVILSVITALLFGFMVFITLWSASLSLSGFQLRSCALAGGFATLFSLTFGLVTINCGEAFSTARATRGAGLGFLALTFAIRVVADIFDIAWLRWLSPFGWRDVIHAFDRDTLWPLAVFFAVNCVLLLPIVLTRRDLHEQWLPRRDQVTPRVSGFSFSGLWWRLHGGLFAWWSVAIIAIGTGFYALTGEMNSLMDSSPRTKELLSLMTTNTDLVSIFAEFTSPIIGILVCCMVISLVVSFNQHEHHGQVSLLLSTGLSLKKNYTLTWVFSCIAAVVVTVVTGVIASYCAIADSRVPDSSFSILVWSIIDLLPAAIACAGIAAFIIGCWRRLSALVWLPLAGSGLITYFGELLKFPDWLQKLSVFAWAPHAVDHYYGAAVLIVIGFSTFALGLIRFTHRDLAE
ncbi:MAG: hypothetical protein Q4D85_07555 [Corynebacterium sp.]|uniref:hypothetical protein n=1 Tax=Corynebacterium sp. TaxID=1720 RepID=UPI0026DD4AEB|nr:hypothetical protein [Corynebacterium sp.]MDO5098604.1 hypothetical protein [Corynebacterium sp.]